MLPKIIPHEDYKQINIVEVIGFENTTQFKWHVVTKKKKNQVVLLFKLGEKRIMQTTQWF